MPVSGQEPAPRFGLQTYSLRYEARKDLPATLALIRQMGFEEVEVSGLYDRTAAEYRRLLDDNGLKAISMMTSYEQLCQGRSKIRPLRRSKTRPVGDGSKGLL